MKDRIPANPGRVLITPENGPAYYATLTRADNPVQVGDALNKQNLLPDEVAEKLGLNPADNPVPADAFAALAENTELLWENGSPNSAFAPQTVGLDLSKYTKVEIIFAFDVNGGWHSSFYVFPVNTGEYLRASEVFDQYGISRKINRITNTGIDFGAGVRTTLTDGGYGDNNQDMIPYQIYGIKGVS